MRSILRVASALLSAALLVSGCSSSPVGEALGQRREWRVAEDRDATADQIIDAGEPDSVAGSGARILVTYVVRSDDDEGPMQGAWRLYDEDWDPVAQGRLPYADGPAAGTVVHGLPDGFLVESYTGPRLVLVDTAGRATPVAAPRKPRTTSAGDVLLEGLGVVPSFYDPDEGSAYRLPRLPRNQQSVVLDDHGTVWVLLPSGWASVVRSPRGASPWQRVDAPVQAPASGLRPLSASRGRVLLAAGRWTTRSTRYDTVWTRPSGLGRSGWEPEPLTRITASGAAEIVFDAMPDGRLVARGVGEGAWIQEDDGFEPLPLPGDRSDVAVTVVGDRLVATDWRSHGLYVSDDLGQHWERLPH